MRLGIFGGSFDPIHNGHLILAEQCREQAELDQVLFVPASVSPFKTDGPVASAKHRLEMLSLALAGHRAFEISEVEIERKGKSYTVDTLNDLKQKNQESDLFLLIGSDSLESFARWKEPEAICRLAIPLVVRRPSARNSTNPAIADLEKLKPHMDDLTYQRVLEFAIDGRLIEISSSDIRTRITTPASIRYLLPRAVEKYIETNNLYVANE